LSTLGRRSRLFRFVAIAFALASIETTTQGMYWVAYGRFMSVSTAVVNRAGLANGEDQPLKSSVFRPLFTEMVPEEMNPYVGYTYGTGGERREGYLADYGFNDNKRLITESDDKKYVVGIFGGSVAGQVYDVLPEHLTHALTQASGLGDRKIVLENFSEPGWKQPQQLFALVYLLQLGAHLDAVINLDGFNEVALVGENIEKGVFAHYPRNWFWRSQQITDPELLKIQKHLVVLRESRRKWASMCSLGWPLEWSPFFNILWEARDLHLAGQEFDEKKTLYNYRKEGELAHEVKGPTRTYVGSKAVYQDASLSWVRASTQMSQICRANGISYFGFVQPNQYVPGSKPKMSREESLIAFDQGAPYSSAVSEGYALLLAEIPGLRSKGVVVTDLTQIFHDVPEVVYSDSCCHFNERGLNVIAERMAETIRETLISDGRLALDSHRQ